MSDHADKLRDILELTDCSRGQWEPLLDALEAERDEALRERIRAEEAARVATALMEGAQQACGDLRARALAAEAEVQRLQAEILRAVAVADRGVPTRSIEIIRAALAETT